MSIQRTDAGLVSDTNLCLTREGGVVEASDPRAHQVLINAGKVIPKALIEQFGLKPTGEKKEAKAVAEPKPAAEPKSSVQFRRAEAPSIAGKHGSMDVKRGK